MRTSLRNRLRLGLGAIALTLAALALAAVVALTRLGGAVATILRENYASVIACEQMKEALARQDSAALFATVGREEIARPMLAVQRQRFAAAYAREARNITLPGEGERVRAIAAEYAAYVAAVDRAMAAPAPRAETYFQELLPRFTGLNDDIQAVARLNQAHMEHADRNARALASRTTHAALGISLVAVALALWLAWWLPRALVRPVDALTRTAAAIGAGDLDVTIAPPTVRELVTLADAFRAMVAQLRAYRTSSLGELLAAKDLARSTVECMLDPVVVLAADGGVPLANEAAETAFGLIAGSADELQSEGVAVPDAMVEARDRALATGAAVLPRSLSEAVRWRGRDGERYYLVRAAPQHAAPGEPARAIVVAQDVTRFRRIDELKTDMVATVSHQFKTPLTSLRMATHLLLEAGTGPLTDAQREIVTTARDDTERLRTMVDELLDLVRIEAEAGALRRTPVDPVALLRDVAEAHRTVAREKGVALAVVPAADAGSALIDPERLSIALANLVSNAIRHTPPGGQVALSASRDGAVMRLTVTDTGEGIDPADLPRVLDRASPGGGDRAGRADPAGRERHGLGLTIAREIVLQHGGELLAASAPGRGSVFTVVLPLDPA